MLGLVNIVRTCGECTTRSRGGFLGGLLGALVVVIVLLTGLSWLYEAADSALLGVAASTAEANRIAAWAIGAVLVLLVAGAVGWMLLGRRRAVRDEPVAEAFTAATDRALEARRQAAALPTATRPAVGGGHQQDHQLRQRVTAQRLDRLPQGGDRR